MNVVEEFLWWTLLDPRAWILSGLDGLVVSRPPKLTEDGTSPCAASLARVPGLAWLVPRQCRSEILPKELLRGLVNRELQITFVVAMIVGDRSVHFGIGTVPTVALHPQESLHEALNLFVLESCALDRVAVDIADVHRTRSYPVTRARSTRASARSQLGARQSPAAYAGLSRRCRPQP